MATPFKSEALRWLGHNTHIAVHDLAFSLLPGATSSSVFLVHNTSQDARFVLRVLDNQAWLNEEPDLARHEAAALEEAGCTGLPTPELIAYDAGDAGFGAPVVLMSYLPGHLDIRPQNFDAWIEALACTLAQLHQHCAPDFAWQYRSWVNPELIGVPEWTGVPHIWERAIEVWRAGEPEYEPVFIHRDYHPLNTLWQHGKLCGVIDWINACRGPAGVDIAHCRTNLALMYGVEVADSFLNACAEYSCAEYSTPEYSGARKLPGEQAYWDIASVFDMCLPRPEFYTPWKEFGLDLLSPAMLNRRIDLYLETIVQRL